MAEPLKNGFGPDVARKIATMIKGVYPSFPATQFVRTVLHGYDELELMARARKISSALHAHLPTDYENAIEILLESLGSADEVRDESNPMASFLYMPHGCFVAEHGIDHFDTSMRANYELTKRFTAEFSIRPFISTYPTKTLTLLRKWTRDPSVDVRRLVSEGTRPRLPWASRLPEFQRDPAPVLDLLERLKDDSELYVRRSVANNLNDIGKDNPEVLIDTAAAWMKGASRDREWLVRHALRSAVKRGDPGALNVLGFGDGKGLRVGRSAISPEKVKIGDAVTVSFNVTNTTKRQRPVMVDFRIHYVKANGTASPKVFKMKSLDLASGESGDVVKKVSVANMTTRRHYAGRHQVDAILNGQIQPIGYFDLT